MGTPKQLLEPSCDEQEMDSADEALCAMLGIDSIGIVTGQHDETETSNDFDSLVRQLSQQMETDTVQASVLQEERRIYEEDGFVEVPESYSIPDSHMRRITDELVWSRSDGRGSNNTNGLYTSDKTYETVSVMCSTTEGLRLSEKRVLTRLENFVNHHPEWQKLTDYIGQLVSLVVGVDMVLFKEKLNLKPPGGSGFAPHLDTPSLRIALGEKGPQTFLTVMVAIDAMTTTNGCLRICKGAWGENHCVETIVPEKDGNPDAGGRAGAIPSDIAETLLFDEIICRGGSIVIFGGLAPHRSAANTSPFPRRAVFLTYNPASEGDFHDEYYRHMERLRNEWRSKVGLATRTETSEDEQAELAALATIPLI